MQIIKLELTQTQGMRLAQHTGAPSEYSMQRRCHHETRKIKKQFRLIFGLGS
jgi:hypothetical protein